MPFIILRPASITRRQVEVLLTVVCASSRANGTRTNCGMVNRCSGNCCLLLSTFKALSFLFLLAIPIRLLIDDQEEYTFICIMDCGAAVLQPNTSNEDHVCGERKKRERTANLRLQEKSTRLGVAPSLE
jgi:hypothetical protein